MALGALSRQQATSTAHVTLVKRSPARANPLSGRPQLAIRPTRRASTQKAHLHPLGRDTRSSESTGAPMGFGPGIGRVTTTGPTSRKTQTMTGDDALATTSDARNLHAENDTPAGWPGTGSRQQLGSAPPKNWQLAAIVVGVVRTAVAAQAISDHQGQWTDRMAPAAGPGALGPRAVDRAVRDGAVPVDYRGWRRLARGNPSGHRHPADCCSSPVEIDSAPTSIRHPRTVVPRP